MTTWELEQEVAPLRFGGVVPAKSSILRNLATHSLSHPASIVVM